MADKQTIDLGAILRQFPEFQFSMDTFNDRLKLQKLIYLLQASGVFLGYQYSWYLRGPYCSTLATCGFELREIYDEIPEKIKIEFPNLNTRDKFAKFKKAMANRWTDNDFLEIAASVHLLYTLGKKYDQTIEKVAAKQKRFTEEQVKQVWEELKEWGLLK